VSLVARYLEENNVSTVIIGSARDIVEECGVARFIFNDFPLGNPCGKPWDVAMQHAIMGMALDLLERAWIPRTTVQTPFQWDNDNWRNNFMRVDESNKEALAKEGEMRRQFQADMKKGR
jgi:hypothetical protein